MTENNRINTEHIYIVSGGYITSDFETNNCKEAIDCFMNRVKHTKPFTNCEIELTHKEMFGDLCVRIELMHRVVTC